MEMGTQEACRGETEQIVVIGWNFAVSKMQKAPMDRARSALTPMAGPLTTSTTTPTAHRQHLNPLYYGSGHQLQLNTAPCIVTTTSGLY